MQKEQKRAWIIFSIVMIALIAWSNLSHKAASNPEPQSSSTSVTQPQTQRTAEQQAAASLQSMQDTAQVVCRSAVKHGLKAPDSADFQEYSYDFVKQVRPGTFYVETKADALNSFGAKLRFKFGCAVQCSSEDDCTVRKLQEF
jgi:hypothetical protein